MAASRPNVARIALERAFEPSMMKRRGTVGLRPRSTRLSINACTVAAFSVAPSTSPSGCLSPFTSTPIAATRVMSLMTLLCRVEIKSGRVDITLSRGRLTQLLAGSLDLTMLHQAPTNAPDDLLRLMVQVSLKRVGREMRMLVENADDQTPADPSLLRIIARAHNIQARLIQNPKLSVHDIAREEHVSAAYL